MFPHGASASVCLQDVIKDILLLLELRLRDQPSYFFVSLQLITNIKEPRSVVSGVIRGEMAVTGKVWVTLDAALRRAARIKGFLGGGLGGKAFHHASFEKWLLVKMWEQTTIWLAVRFIYLFFFSHRLPIFGAHVNKLAHELAACWDTEMHSCPIILSVICFRFRGAAAEWASRLNHPVSHLGVAGCYLRAGCKWRVAKCFSLGLFLC